MKITDMRTPKEGSLEYRAMCNSSIWWMESVVEDQSLIEIAEKLNNLLTEFGDEELSSGDRKRLEKSISQVESGVRCIYLNLQLSNRGGA